MLAVAFLSSLDASSKVRCFFDPSTPGPNASVTSPSPPAADEIAAAARLLARRSSSSLFQRQRRPRYSRWLNRQVGLTLFYN